MANRILLYWLPLIVWICGIFLVSSLPSNSFPDESLISVPTEYPLHITAFFVLFLLFYRLLRSNTKKAALKGILLSSLIFTMTVSFSKECWQLLIPTRSFSLKDIVLDGGAAILAMIIVSIRANAIAQQWPDATANYYTKSPTKDDKSPAPEVTPPAHLPISGRTKNR